MTDKRPTLTKETPFQRMARRPTFWRISANDLRHSASLILDAISCDNKKLEAMKSGETIPAGAAPAAHLWDVYSMLAGLALENLAKGVIIKKTPELVGPTSLASFLTRGSHRLRPLFAKAGISVNVDEGAFLDLCSECILWAGRYPVPKTVPANPKSLTFFGTYPKTFNLLYERVDACLR